MVAYIQKLSWSEAVWSKVVFSPRRSSASFSLCCCATPSVSQKMVSSSAPGAMATFSTLPVCAQRPRSAGSWLGRCCLLMTPLWLPIPRMHYSVSSAVRSCLWWIGLTISLKKSNVMGQDVSSTPCISIGHHTLETVEDFIYLGSTISSNLSLDNELNTRIGKASIAMARLTKRVWNNSMLTTNTKMKVYQASVLNILLYGSETWTTYIWQERRLNSFHCAAWGGSWASPGRTVSQTPNVLDQAKTFSLHALLSQDAYAGSAMSAECRMAGFLRTSVYGELTSGTRPTGRPALRYKDVCKRDLKAGSLNPADLDAATADHVSWRLAVRTPA